MRHYFFTILLLWPILAQSQTEEIDSLKSRLSDAEGSPRVQLLVDLARVTKRGQPADAINYTTEALELLKVVSDPELEIEALYHRGWADIYIRRYDSAQVHVHRIDSIARSVYNDTGIAKAFFLKGRIARQQGEYEYSISLLDSAQHLVEEITDVHLKLQILNEIGSVYRRQGENSRALNYHTEALELSRELGDKVSISTTLGYIGIIHDILGNYDEALSYQQQTLELRRELNDRRGVAAALTNIGIMHQKIESYEEAMHFYHEALTIWEELDRELEMASVYNNMGGVQDLLGNYEVALHNYEKALAIWQKYGEVHRTSIALRNIGSVYMLMGNNEVALDMHRQSLEIRQTLGDRNGSASSLLDIAEIHQVLGQMNFALETAIQGLELAEETESWPLVRDAHEILASIYETKEDYANALVHFKAFKAATDTLFNIDSQAVIADLQEQYKTREQQQQIALLQQQGKIRNLWLGVLIGGLLCIGTVLVLLYSRYYLKQKNYRVQQALQEKEIEQARLRSERMEAEANFLQADNKRKTMELEAARELQLSMLPSAIPEHPAVNISAFMKTATEVGGDYYDFDLAEDGTLTVAIGDATGHGAKAGTMVTAVKSLFKLLAKHKELPEILRLGSKAIKKMNITKLYMALALLRLRENELELAGAGMPPALIYRAATEKIETVALKGMPLGSIDDYPYQKTEVILHERDVVLLASDGFAELFNNEGEMLGYEIIPELLAEVGDKDPEEILHHFKNTASDWIGDHLPQDDITFIVLKIKAVDAEPVG